MIDIVIGFVLVNSIVIIIRSFNVIIRIVLMVRIVYSLYLMWLGLD